MHVCSSLIEVDLLLIQSTLKTPDTGRRILAVNHTFIKHDMTSSLDFASKRVDAMRIAHGLLVAKENALADMNIKIGISLVRR